MKKRTRWKRCYPTIIGKEFFDGGEYGLGYFTVLKAWTCKTYSQAALFLDDTHWFPEQMILVRTRSGLKYKMPFCPWAKVVNSNGKLWGEDYDKNPW